MVAFLASLATIAGMLALNQGLTAISIAKNKKEKVTADDIIKAINKMVSEARTKGNDTLTELNNRLNKINIPFGMSSSVKDYLTTTKRNLNQELTSKTKSLNAVEQKLNDIEQRSNNLANQTEEFKYLYGKPTLEDLKQETQDAIDQTNKILGVESNV